MSTELNTGQDLEEGLESAENAAKSAYDAARTAHNIGKKISEAAKTAGEAAGEAAAGAGTEAAGQAAAAGAEAGIKAAEAGAEAAGQAAAAGAEAGAEAAAATAGGVATGGVSTAVVAGLEAAKHIIGKIHDYEKEATSTELGEGSHWTFKVILIALLGWFLCCSANLEKLVPGSMEEFHEKEYAADKAYAKNLRTGTRTKEFEEKEEFDRKYNNMLFLTNGFNAYIDGLDGFDGGGPGPMIETSEDEYPTFETPSGIPDEETTEPANENLFEQFTGDIAEIFNGALEAIKGEIMNIPGIGDLVECLEINTGLLHKVTRSSTDSYSMEFTLAKAGDYPIISKRISALESLASSSNMGSNGNLYTLNKNGETYYVGAIVDGFATPGGAYKVTLNTGQTFNMVAVDVKSLSDKPGSGGTGQVDTSYGHGYLVNGGQNVQMNICEFLDASTSSKSVTDYSATNYANAPMAKGTYVTQVESLGAF